MDAVTRFLERREALLRRLDEQLQEAADSAEAAQVLCEHAGRELNLADCAVYLPADGTLLPVATWGATHDERRPAAQLPLPGAADAPAVVALRPHGVDEPAPDAPGAAAGDRSELAVAIARDGALLGVLHSVSPEAGFHDARYEAAFLAMAGIAAARLLRLRARPPGAA